ncbi:heme peroxidase [Tateyamaria omphalii]|uniref:peroxidase family protein n=1 Tax=Tateyamaria omphalii TaxID=299262 RepID=UPI001C9922BE|nr:peroxidase family protein [Tateyamaria omphalii]MBY5935243.1 heme peroxidase [Tateyamaria omphalii]
MTILPYPVQRALFSVIEAIPPAAALANRWAINRVVNRARPRPHPLSTERPYVWWGGLTDRRWSSRHLPPRPRDTAPAPDALADLFRRKDGKQRMCPKSTCLFPAFAQYLTDGFIRTESEDLVPDGEDPAHRLKRNTSNHEIDLCPLYGRTREQTLALRHRSEKAGEKGRLASQMINGEEYAPFLYTDGKVDPRFQVLDPPLGQSTLDDTRRATIFAFGGDRANSVPQVAMLNTLFLREHNRLAAEIEVEHPDWDDARVFETARNSMIVMFIKIVVEDYINHISPLPFTLRADPSVAWNAPWNKPNWITTEFSLLYRWHALIPDALKWGGEARPVASTFMNNALLMDGGLLSAFEGISATQAAELGPCNTAEPLLHIEVASIQQDRDCALASFSDYCDYMSQRRPANFEAISSDPDVAGMLRDLYDGPRDVDFHVGLFCEDRVPNSPLPNLVLKFVALDAFSQALTNPLLSRHVFKRSTFSGPGWRAINRTQTLRDVVDRNVEGGAGDTFIGMTRPEWRPE